MYSKSELKMLSKGELIRKLFAQEELNMQLIERVQYLEAVLQQLENFNTPSSQKRFKENTKKDSNSDKPRFPGREKGHHGAGIRMPKPDKIVEHTLNDSTLQCIGKEVKWCIDLVDKPFIVTKHIIYHYRDKQGKLVIPEVHLPKKIYGKNLQSFVSLLKGKLGASHQGIADIIVGIRPELSFCPATSLALTNAVAENLKEERQNILQEVRNASYCQADETGLRHDGINGYTWVFCNSANVIYETDMSRGKLVPQRVLGEDYNKVTVNDGWNAYNQYIHQRCWVHLLRELDALAENNKEITQQADYLHSVYNKALAMKEKPPDEREVFIKKMNAIWEIPYAISVLLHAKGCKKFATKLQNALSHLFIGVRYPEIPLDNNHAERMLRKIVVHRKLMGCIRNEKGALFIKNTMSALQTWHLQGKNPYEKLKQYAS